MDPVQSSSMASKPAGPSPERQLDEVATLLRRAEIELPSAPPSETQRWHENQLAQVRLGIAGGLFAALRAKNAPTASHSLRVAIDCSAWSVLIDVSHQERDELEVAALLHDIGKIGIPDRILLKPGELTVDEYRTMELTRSIGAEILSACCTSQGILETVRRSGDWYNGQREGQVGAGEEIPRGARMLAIVDAFDAMTTDQVYRRAMSRERAMAELFEFAGTQFDPQLVQKYCDFLSSDQAKMHVVVCRQWLKDLKEEATNEIWRLRPAPPRDDETGVPWVIPQKLLESMHDAVVFVDQALRIVLWNRAAEILTGISHASVREKQWSPTLVHLRDERHKVITDAECPVARSIQTMEPTLRRFSIVARNGQRLEVDANVIPVTGTRGDMHGSLLLLRDASTQVTLEQRVKSLHEKATRDALTQVANRSEFDRSLEAAVHSHLPKGLPLSLIVCDLDHFKRINDHFGHQAGDNVLVSFAQLLKANCRPGDLVARYGGEEFVILCPDCDNATATQRAETIRAELERTRQAALGGEHITASFGVTELQQGDTPETLFRRGDRALYQAKDNGRNVVVQLGTGIVPEERPHRGGWFSWFRGSQPNLLLSGTLVTAVPINLATEKLRGFVSDHHAAIDTLGEHRLAIRIDGENLPLTRRAGDRAIPFVIELTLEESQGAAESKGTGRTLVHLNIRPQRSRDRRHRDLLERARQLVASLKAYLVAQEQEMSEPPASDGVIERARKAVIPWWHGSR